jgi:hypothetical protein
MQVVKDRNEAAEPLLPVLHAPQAMRLQSRSVREVSAAPPGGKDPARRAAPSPGNPTACAIHEAGHCVVAHALGIHSRTQRRVQPSGAPVDSTRELCVDNRASLRRRPYTSQIDFWKEVM